MDFYDKDELRITEPLPIDTDCNFKCGPGFNLVGSPTRNCLPLSKWDGIQTACKRVMRNILTATCQRLIFNLIRCFSIFRNFVSAVAGGEIR